MAVLLAEGSVGIGTASLAHRIKAAGNHPPRLWDRPPLLLLHRPIVVIVRNSLIGMHFWDLNVWRYVYTSCTAYSAVILVSTSVNRLWFSFRCQIQFRRLAVQPSSEYVANHLKLLAAIWVGVLSSCFILTHKHLFDDANKHTSLNLHKVLTFKFKLM
jgi:hypothetical protein